VLIVVGENTSSAWLRGNIENAGLLSELLEPRNKSLKTVTYFIAEVFVSAMTLSVEHVVDSSGRWYRWARSTRFRSCYVTRRPNVCSLRPTRGFAVAMRIMLDRTALSPT